MKRLAAAVALGLAWMALPVCAQHGAAHGGFAGHSAPAPRSGGFSGAHSLASRPDFASASGYRQGRGPVAVPGRFAGLRGVDGRPGLARPVPRNAAGAFIRRPPYSRAGTPTYGATGSDHHRRPYIPAYRSGYGYGVLGYSIPWFAAAPGYTENGYADDPYANDPDGSDEASVPPAVDGGNGAAYGEAPYEGAPALPPYPPAPATQAPPASPQPPQQAVTLIFRDGRPPEQIHNYILTGNTLYVGNRWPAEIPVDQLDLAETVKVNRDAGVDFQMPAGAR